MQIFRHMHVFVFLLENCQTLLRLCGERFAAARASPAVVVVVVGIIGDVDHFVLEPFRRLLDLAWAGRSRALALCRTFAEKGLDAFLTTFEPFQIAEADCELILPVSVKFLFQRKTLTLLKLKTADLLLLGRVIGSDTSSHNRNAYLAM